MSHRSSACENENTWRLCIRVFIAVNLAVVKFKEYGTRVPVEQIIRIIVPGNKVIDNKLQFGNRISSALNFDFSMRIATEKCTNKHTPYRNQAIKFISRWI